MNKDVTGIILKSNRCEYEEYCTKSGVRCMRNTGTTHTCGYCKAFRLIDINRKDKNEPELLKNTL